MAENTTIDDGGPAFPLPIDRDWGHGKDPHGMSLRDYFASSADQPGCVEAYQLAGEPEVECPVGWSAPAFVKDKGGRADTWWKTLTLDQKYQYYTQLRYMIADAMISARKKGTA